MQQQAIRCIITEPSSAAFNMAADLHLMEQAAEHGELYLRLYEWDPPAVSIGALQHASRQLDLKRLEDDGITWIRRPTGGRAVLHRDDLTYSTIFPRNFPGTGTTVTATYSIIMKCLVHAFTRIGIVPEVQDSADPLIKSSRHVKLPCFLAPNRDEIMVAGRKLVGSAQYRNRGAVLQHGSIPFSDAPCSLPHYLQLDDDEQQQQTELLQTKSTWLGALLPSVSKAQVTAALLEGFSEGFSRPVIDEPFSESEHAAIRQLAESETFLRLWCSDPDER